MVGHQGNNYTGYVTKVTIIKGVTKVTVIQGVIKVIIIKGTSPR